MKSDLDAKITAGLGIIIFMVIAAFKGAALFNEITSVISTAITLTVGARFIFVRWIWKWRVCGFLGWCHKVPLLEGHWTGTVQSTGNPSTPEERKQVSIQVDIAQPNIHSIKITRTSDESTSHSFGEVIQNNEDGSLYLSYSYVNEPKATVRGRSPISYGTARLAVIRGPQIKMEGNYWSDQKTTGTISILKAK